MRAAKAVAISLDIAREFFRLNRGAGRLSLAEYVQFGLYDKTRYSPAEQAEFLSLSLHWPITHVCCDMTWQATTEDKWLCSHILARSEVRVPQTLAVIDKSDRHYPGTHKISSAAGLKDFMTAGARLPLFGKENRGICSFGVFLAQEADATGMVLKGQERINYDVFMEKFIGDTPYLLQEIQRNHAFFDRYTDNLATVRVCILVTKAGVKIPFCVLKLPSRDNVADSFWRKGNLACDIEIDSGKIRTARAKDPLQTVDYTAHPETGAALIGEVVPMWDKVLDLARTCAPIFAPLRYQSMDIAITPRGRC